MDTFFSRCRERSRNEEGMALIGVILLLILASGVCAALAISGQTETKTAYNLDTYAQADAAAQAGLAAAVQAVLTEVNLRTSLGSTAAQAIDGLLAGPDHNAANTADNGWLTSLGFLAPTVTNLLGTLTDVGYRVEVMDDDNWSARGMGSLSSTMLSAVQARISENGSTTGDNNGKFVVRSTGIGRNNTSVTVEATLGLVTLPAIVTNGDLTISGNVTVTGQNGGVHTNSNLLINGASGDIAKDATATGTATINPGVNIGGNQGGGYATKPVPHVEAANYFMQADYILNSDGLIYARSGSGLGAVQCGSSAACETAFGWTYGGGGDWSVTGNTVHAGSYYLYGSASVSGSPGSHASPVSMTIIAEGSISITGNPDFQPDAPELFLVTNGDLKIAGNLGTPIALEGEILVREQVSLHGTPEIAGRILVEDASNLRSLVTANEIAGNPTITYNGIAGSDTFALAAWRVVK